MALALSIRNRQRTRPVNVRLLRRITRTLLQDLLHLDDADLGVFIVAAPKMTRLNETYLRHAGSTDVITFDYSDTAVLRLEHRREANSIHGEVFICVDEARVQARRFRTSWQAELVRYVVHGVLHLLGFDDATASKRRRMKREEARLLRALATGFPLSRLGFRR